MQFELKDILVKESLVTTTAFQDNLSKFAPVFQM